MGNQLHGAICEFSFYFFTSHHPIPLWKLHIPTFTSFLEKYDLDTKEQVYTERNIWKKSLCLHHPQNEYLLKDKTCTDTGKKRKERLRGSEGFLSFSIITSSALLRLLLPWNALLQAEEAGKLELLWRWVLAHGLQPSHCCSPLKVWFGSPGGSWVLPSKGKPKL